MGEADQTGTATSDPVPEDAWTVEQLNYALQDLLTGANDQLPTHVVGEIADISHYDFGTFFELRDLDADPSIGCLAWAAAIQEFDHDLEAGTKAVVKATVDFYPDRGDCQLVVKDYWPIGESARYQELAQLRESLSEEGLFDDDRKQPIPAYSACIGTVTSSSGSAIEDLWAAISDRSPRTDLKLHGATVQGDHAVESMLKAIDAIDRDPDVETIVLTRGGGSDVHLWCFNAEPLVRRVAACQTPVVVAIGHEDDETLVEAVADKRAMTPTEAGVVATTDVKTTRDRLLTLERRADSAYRSLVDDRLEALDRRVESAVAGLEQRVTEHESRQQRARDLERRIAGAYDRLVQQRLDTLDERIDGALADLELAAESEVATERVAHARLADLDARIDGAYRAHIDRKLSALDHRIDTGYRTIEADARVELEHREVRRLRLAVLVLLAVLLVGALAVSIFLL